MCDSIYSDSKKKKNNSNDKKIFIYKESNIY